MHAVGDLLRNKFFAGYVKYKENYYQGLHDAIASTDLYDSVQDVLRKNNGRSRTFSTSPPRHYLLQGVELYHEHGLRVAIVVATGKTKDYSQATS